MQPTISSDEFKEIIDHCVPFLGNYVVVAVSGGADSMALCLLMHEWCQSNDITFHALTVDHGLRQESSSEAQIVHQWLSQRSIQHSILTWQHDQIHNRIQEKARDARYHLLFEWCSNNHATSLLTAHHALDQWETFMIRLSKGSGLKGLCAIRNVTTTNFGYLIRPLLHIEPERLKTTLERFQQDFIHDPSNDQERFTRIRWRKLYPSLHDMGLTTTMIGKSIQDLDQVNKWIDECVLEGKKKSWIPPNLNLDVYQELPRIVRNRLLNDIIIEVGKTKYPVNRQLIERIDQMIIDNNFKTLTVGYCILKKKNSFLIVKTEKII